MQNVLPHCVPLVFRDEQMNNYIILDFLNMIPSYLKRISIGYSGFANEGKWCLLM